MVFRLASAVSGVALVLLAGAACSSPKDPSTADQATSVAAVTAPGGAALLVNEVLANEPGAATSGEMIELVNTSAVAIDLTGFTISDGVTVRHTFGATTLGAGRALAIFGGAAGVPAGLTNAVASSTGSLSLGNGGDTVTLRDAGGVVVDAVTYDATLASSDGVSFNRNVDGSPAATAWALHTTLAAALASPGKRTDGADFTPQSPPPDAGAPDSAGDSAPDSAPPDAGPNAGDTGPLRIVAGNLSTGTQQSYDPGEGIRILQALKPDVALLQELNYGAGDDASVRAFVDAAFGTSYQYVREPGVQIPNGVVSRYPILSAGVWDDPQVTNRDFTWARIDIPGARDLWAVSVHLLTSNAAARGAEATALVGYLQSNVPAGDYVAIGGDLNTGDPALLGILAAVVDVNASVPDDQFGNVNTNASRGKHYDWVLVNAGLEAYQRPTRVGSVERPNGLVFDTRSFSPITDAPPARATDSAGVAMQHMAIVKDFFVQ